MGSEASPSQCHLNKKDEQGYMTTTTTAPRAHLRHFDPWRLANSDHAKAIIVDATRTLNALEVSTKSRQRARKVFDQMVRTASIESILSDAEHGALSHLSGLLITQSKKILGRGKPDQFRHAVFSKQLPEIIRQMVSCELIELDRGYVNCPFSDETLDTEAVDIGAPATLTSQRTCIRAGKELLRLMATYPINFKSLTFSQGEELVLMKADKRHYMDTTQIVRYKHADNPFSSVYRRDLDLINTANSRLDLDFDNRALEADHAGMLVDSSDTRYRRIFNLSSWQRGGRYYGPCWQPLHKRERLNGLTLHGEPYGEVDFGQTYPRLAYAIAGQPLPPGDFYSVDGIDSAFRPCIKKLVLALLSTKQRPTKWPASLLRLPNGKDFIELYGTVERAVDLLEVKLAAIRPLLYNAQDPLCFRLMFKESQILTQIHLQLLKSNVVGLGTFDAVLVPVSKIPLAQQVMAHIWRREVPSVPCSLSTLLP